MDAPGFPDAAGGPYVALVWVTLAVLVVVSLLVTLRCGRRTQRAGRTALVGLGLVVAAWLFTPPTADADPDTVGSRGAECPFDAVAGAHLLVDHSTRMYAFWQPCETASRLRLGLGLGGYALVAGSVGLWMLRSTARPVRVPPPQSQPSG